MSGVWDEGESFKTGSSQKQSNMEVFVEWLLTPQDLRDPATRAGLSDVLGVTTQTLRNYERDPWLIAQMSTRRRATIKVTKLDAVLGRLVERALDDDPKQQGAANVATKILLTYVETQEDAVSASALAEMSDDELRQTIVNIWDRLNATSD